MTKTLLLLFSIGWLQGAHAQHTIERPGFSLQYPANWQVDTEDEDYDPDALFSIDSPDGGSMIMFVIFDRAADTAHVMREQVAAFTAQLIKNPELAHFDTWGKYKGSGTVLKGKLMDVFKGTVRIFVYTDNDKTMTVVEQFFDKDYEGLRKGYELISSSFQFKLSKNTL